ncbi:MAG: DeoR/GlpR family DNA-binding transcription regulator [Prevotellaceae bacterium]|jgi:DeoR family transcriptional regulator of aga operon|nr:DeoR/GlpR family DNA-binding transcription regulator [Prevotellaceae bacterium]
MKKGFKESMIMETEKQSMAQRHRHILELLRRTGEMRVVDICNEVDVSQVTVRKDIKLLERKKLLFRLHGSVSLLNPYLTRDVSVSEKELIKVEEKVRIARHAATLINDTDAIIIASGTTVLSLARQLEAKQQLTVLTSALNVATVLCQNPAIEVIQLGGIVRKTSTSVNGPFIQQMLSQFSCSKLFLGVDGIDLEYGCTTSNLMEANANQYMIAAVQRTIILTDSSKFGKRGFGRICSFDKVHQIITDDKVSESVVVALEDMGVEVTVV